MVLALSAAVREFLDAKDRFATIATTNADGTPHQAVVWFERRGDRVVINGRADRRWVANAKRTGRGSVAIVDAYDYVIVAGPLSAVESEQQSLEDIRALARRYGEAEDEFKDQRRVTFVMIPERVAVHGRLARG